MPIHTGAVKGDLWPPRFNGAVLKSLWRTGGQVDDLVDAPAHPGRLV